MMLKSINVSGVAISDNREDQLCRECREHLEWLDTNDFYMDQLSDEELAEMRTPVARPLRHCDRTGRQWEISSGPQKGKNIKDLSTECLIALRRLPTEHLEAVREELIRRYDCEMNRLCRRSTDACDTSESSAIKRALVAMRRRLRS